jgi:hypothetical protein
MPEFEKEPKSSIQLLFEGCLILILLGVVIGAACTLVILMLNKALY